MPNSSPDPRNDADTVTVNRAALDGVLGAFQLSEKMWAHCHLSPGDAAAHMADIHERIAALYRTA